MGSARRTILNLSRALHALERAVCLGSRAAHSLHNLYAAQGDLVALRRRRPLKAHSSSASREASRNPPPTVTPKPHSYTHQPEPAGACPSLVIVLDNSTSANLENWPSLLVRAACRSHTHEWTRFPAPGSSHPRSLGALSRRRPRPRSPSCPPPSKARLLHAAANTPLSTDTFANATGMAIMMTFTRSP
jgi:hypothetical protein